MNNYWNYYFIMWSFMLIWSFMLMWSFVELQLQMAYVMGSKPSVLNQEYFAYFYSRTHQCNIDLDMLFRWNIQQGTIWTTWRPAWKSWLDQTTRDCNVGLFFAFLNTPRVKVPKMAQMTHFRKNHIIQWKFNILFLFFLMKRIFLTHNNLLFFSKI